MCQLDACADLARIGLGWTSLYTASQLPALSGPQGHWTMCFHHSAGQPRLVCTGAARFTERAWKCVCLLGPRLGIGTTFSLLVKAYHRASSHSKGSERAASWWEAPQSYIERGMVIRGEYLHQFSKPHQPIGCYGQEGNWMAVVLRFLTCHLFASELNDNQRGCLLIQTSMMAYNSWKQCLILIFLFFLKHLFLDAYYTDILIQAYIFFIANIYSDCVGIHFDRSVLMPHVRSKILNIIPDWMIIMYLYSVTD